MNIKYFTSMDRKYYDHCGKAMLESFRLNYPKMEINLYNEGGFKPEIDKCNLMGWNLGLAYLDFVKRHSKNKKVVTFAKKGFSIIDAMNNIECDRLVWLDADSIIRMPIHSQLINLMCPSDTLSAHFKVRHVKNEITYTSCETGFFILNTTHPNFDDFKNIYTNIYHKDESSNLRRFYDGEVYGETVVRLEDKGIKMMDLNPGPHKTPISRSLIAPYFQHFKAGLKDKIDNEYLEETYLQNQDEV